MYKINRFRISGFRRLLDVDVDLSDRPLEYSLCIQPRGTGGETEKFFMPYMRKCLQFHLTGMMPRLKALP
jgi:hypothetical protein